MLMKLNNLKKIILNSKISKLKNIYCQKIIKLLHKKELLIKKLIDGYGNNKN